MIIRSNLSEGEKGENGSKPSKTGHNIATSLKFGMPKCPKISKLTWKNIYFATIQLFPPKSDKLRNCAFVRYLGDFFKKMVD